MVSRTIEHRGGVLAARQHLEAIEGADKIVELLVEGPRGCGKSNGIAYLLFKFCRMYSGVRVLVIRKHRSLLTDTFCKTYEEDVCPGHDSTKGPQRTQRHDYVFSNDSRIVLGGLDDIERYYGSDWDIILAEEAVQFSWKHLEKFLGSLRNGKLPFHAMIYATNPDAPSHWLNKRANAGLCKRFKCYHKDNPAHWDQENQCWTLRGKQFMGTLERYTGTDRKRHVKGEWAGAEGMVWDNWDETLHLRDREANIATQFGIKSYFAAQDWGFAKPGCLAVFGVTNDRYLVRVAEVYHTKRGTEWWADWAIRFVDQYKIERIECDPADPKNIVRFNEILVRTGNKAIARKADNTKASSGKGDLQGIDLVRWGFSCDEQGKPRIVLLKNSLVHPPDPELVAANQPICTEEEISGYVHARDATGEVIKDTTDDVCPDHGCDVLRYACTSNWNRDTRGHSPITAPKFGSYASVMMQRNPEAVREWLEMDSHRAKAALKEAKQ